MKRLSNNDKEQYKLIGFSKKVIIISSILSVLLYIISFICGCMLPVTDNYLYMKTLYNGLLETAPAVLAAGVCAALLADIIYKKDIKDR